MNQASRAGARDRDGARAKYVVVREHLLALIADGLSAGDPLPSERNLTDRKSVV